LNTAKSTLLKKVSENRLIVTRVVLKCDKGHPPAGIQKALELEEKMRHLIASYIGINFQVPDAFYAPPGFVRVCYRRSFVHVLSTAKTSALRSL